MDDEGQVDVQVDESHTPRTPHFWEALISFAALIGAMALAIIVFEVDPHIPLLIGTAVASLIALRLGWKWSQIETMMFDGVRKAMQALIILALIGILIGVWLQAGIVPAMITYGLEIMHPNVFLVATVIICALTSLATGTSWGTAGTLGIAFMGIGAGLGIPAPIVAGAVISGAYFGDKLSPLSDTTNLAPAMSGTDVFTHIKFMLRPTLVALVIALVVFGIMGFTLGIDSGANLEAVKQIQEGLNSQFNVNLLLLLPPLLVIGLMAFKVPAIPGITAGIVIGAIFGAIFQGVTLGDIMDVSYNGFSAETGVKAVDSLLDSGGVTKMFYAISLAMFAMTFGGIVEGTGQMQVLIAPVIKRLKGAIALIAGTMATTLVSNAAMPDQYISLIVPGRMYSEAYAERGYHPKMLSNALESGGTVLSVLIPWNTCGVFMFGVLGVHAWEYAPYAVFNYATPVVVLILAIFGVTVAKRSDDLGSITSGLTQEEEAELVRSH